ncbi:MAG: TonB-dependent receptor [Limnobacter sp.]|nr:TonB-dependent receptor [Limnobacter sp.]
MSGSRRSPGRGRFGSFVSPAAVALAGLLSCLPARAQPAVGPAPSDPRAAATAASEASAARGLDAVVVTGYRVPTLQREAADSLSIVTRDDIQRQQPANGVDLFRQIPGLQIDQPGAPGGLSSVYIRGSDPNHVLVLIDGVRVNDPTNSRGGGFDLSNLEPTQVDRIEVLRGAASSVYGADAMGGVINVVTRRDATGATRGEVGAGVGGHAFRSANGRVSGGTPQANFSIGASTRRDGRDEDGSELDLRVFSGTARFAIGPTAAIDVDLRHSERDSSSFPDDSGGIRLAEIRTLERKHARDTSYSLRGRWDFGDTSTLNAALTRYERDEDIDSPGVAPGSRNPIGVPAANSRTEFERDNLLANLVFHLPEGSEFAVGAEYQREHGINRTVYTLFGMAIPANFDLERDTRSTFAEFKWLATDDLVLRAGLRHDRVDGIGSNTSPSAGAHYSLRRLGGAIKLSYSEGFKPPSFFALGLPPALSGNPDLRAEHSKGATLTYEQRLAGESKAAISLFRTRYTDLVTFDNATNQLVNANTVDVRGAEFELLLKPTDALSLRAHFTRLLTDVVDSDEPLRQRPGRRAGFQLFYSFDESSQIAWSTEYIADVFDSSVPTGNLMLPTALRSDLNYTVRLRKWLQAAVAIDNVFDRDNEAFVGFVDPGRRLRVSVTASF